MAARTNSIGLPEDSEKLGDPWKGDMPPYNTPYWVIARYRGASFLRGWIQVDRQSDHRGYRRRMRHYEITKSDPSHIWK